jgi:Cu/Zn superoxide dismutase
VASYRKAAIAALAASVLLLAPNTAYADHTHHAVAVSSQDSGVSWAYYGGELTDYTQTGPETFADAKAYVMMMGLEGRSVFRLTVTGIGATGGTYGVHLHEGTCVAEDWALSGPHYQVNWNPLADLRDKEVWLDLAVNSVGIARSTATVDFIPEGNRSIVLHAKATNPADGKAGDRLACLPFEINTLGN